MEFLGTPMALDYLW